MEDEKVFLSLNSNTEIEQERTQMHSRRILKISAQKYFEW